MHSYLQLANRTGCNLRPLEQSSPLTVVKVFRDLSSEAVRQLAKRCRWRRYHPKTVILEDGEVSTEVFFVVRGRVQATYHSEWGREVTFTDYREGDLFGELGIHSLPRSASVFSVTETLAAIMMAAHFQEIVRENSQVASAVIASLAETIRTLEKRVIEISTFTVQKRIYAELLRLAWQSSPTAHDNDAIILPAPTHADIASRVSTHREAVTRALSELKRQGLIEKRGRTMVIRDIAALTSMVDQT
jgi:CRP/FNR family transcriptional regulator, cyclic AMP receptor protein